MRARFLLALAAFLSSAASAQSVDSIVIDKSDRILWLMSCGTTVRAYRDIRLGDAPVGHKQFEDDERTPVGTYRVNGRNGKSRYQLSLRISYPNAADRAYAVARGRSPGGDIFIHGQPNGSPIERIPMNWTDGCIALSNAEIREVWRLVADGTRVTIRE